jgi:mono-ADP-ribosyltransferase sirtuin 6
MSSDNYAGRLSEYKNKGICGLPEKNETKRAMDSKIKRLIELIRTSRHTTVVTGAGISTAAGIPDFRGPKGIWTQEEEEKKRLRKDRSQSKKRRLRDSHSMGTSTTTSGDCDEGNTSTTTDSDKKSKIDMESKSTIAAECTPSASFETAKPTITHRAIAYLSSPGVDKIQYCITQNVDGLHMRSGISRNRHCFLHGCIFTEKCNTCGKEYFRDFDIGGVSFKETGRKCDEKDCTGLLRDTILDWEDALPEDDWERAQDECEKSDLVLALGTSLRIEPAGSLPTLGKKFVIINKQDTPYDSSAELVIRANVEDVMQKVMNGLGFEDWDNGK